MRRTHKRSQPKPMNLDDLKRFTEETTALLARADAGISHIIVDYPQVVVEALCTTSRGVEVDAYIDIQETASVLGEEDTDGAIAMLIDTINEDLKEFDGYAEAGGVFEDKRIVRIGFRTNY